MANIIVPGDGSGKWKETPGERSLRQKGFKSSQYGVLEAGITTGAYELRKTNAPGLMKKIAATLQRLCNDMAGLRWDDDEVCLCIGIQVRNKWERGVDGDWHESGTIDALDETARKAIRDGNRD